MPLKLIKCDCSIANKCPQGRVGHAARCEIWQETSKSDLPLGDASVHIRMLVRMKTLDGVEFRATVDRIRGMDANRGDVSGIVFRGRNFFFRSFGRLKGPLSTDTPVPFCLHEEGRLALLSEDEVTQVP